MERLLHVKLPSDPDSASAARMLVGEVADDVPPPRLSDLALLTHELVMNGVRHGPRREGARVELVVARREGHVRVEVADEGPGFREKEQEPEQQAGDHRADRPHLGLRFVEALADRWGIDCVEGTKVWFEISLVDEDAGAGTNGASTNGASTNGASGAPVI